MIDCQQDNGTRAFVSLGANMGNSLLSLESAVAAMGALADTHLVQVSPFYKSAPIGCSGPDFINAVVELQTRMSALELLQQLQRIELLAGRTRLYPGSPRTLDLDLLLFGDQKIVTPALTVPHPRMLERAFVLKPLSDIAPALVDEQALRSVSHQHIEPMPTPNP